MRRAGEGVEVRIGEHGLRVPPGGIAVRTPLARIGEASVNRKPARPGPGGEVVVRELPAEVVLEP